MCSTSFSTRCAAGCDSKTSRLRRNDAVFLDALGVDSLPDPTTTGDFCRRFDAEATMALQEAINRVRLKAWSAAGPSFVGETARIDADASIVATDRRDQGGYGHLPTTASGGTRRCWSVLANTKEPLYLGPSRRQPALP